MHITLLTIGKTSEKYLKEGVGIYTKRLQHYINFSISELPDIKIKGNVAVEQRLKKEADVLLKNIPAEALVVLLDEKGRQYDSVGFSRFLEEKMVSGTKSLFFVVGGAYGFSSAMYSRGQFKISLSKFTFTHEMVRLFFIEQLYRAMTLINRHPYHNA